MAPLRNSNVPEERRHHARHRLTSIVYVELGPGNGGIIVNLGTGGLSLHAATKLNAEAELAVRFRLDSAKGPIESAGRVVWLSPTRKEAGISFKDLPVEAERQIADWIAAQEQPVATIESELEPQPSMTEALPRIPMQAPVPASLTAERFEKPQPSLSLGVPRRALSESSQPAQFPKPASPLQRTTPSPATIPFPTSDARVERPSDILLRGAPAKHYEIIPKPAKPAPAAQELVPKDSVLPSLAPSSAKAIEVSRATPQAIEVNRKEPQANDPGAALLLQRRKLGLTVAACSAGILVLMVTLLSVSRPAAQRDASGQSAEPNPSATLAQAESASETTPEAPADQSGAIAPPEDLPPEAYYDLLPMLPTHQGTTVAQDGGWSTQLEAMLGVDVGRKLDPEVLALPVWTVRHSGYYYCVGDLNSETPQAGALMWQGDALQSGYQPKLGNYCN